MWRALSTARRDTERALSRGRPRKLLVVCYGNIYRSPFAQVMLTGLLGSEFEVRSSGFHPIANRASPPSHVEMCKSFGVSLTSHRSRIVSRADLDWADVVVLMDRRNWLALSSMGTDRAKLVWLGALGEGDVEILDPYDLSPADARVVVQQLDVACRGLVLRLNSKPA